MFGLRGLRQHQRPSQPRIGDGAELRARFFLRLADAGEVALHVLAALDVVGLVVQQAVDLGVEHHGRELDIGAIDEVAEDLVVIAVIALLALGALDVLANALAQGVDGVEALADLLGEVVVELRQHFFLRLGDMDGEVRLLAGELLARHVRGHRQVELDRLALLVAEQLFLEAGEDHVAFLGELDLRVLLVDELLFADHRLDVDAGDIAPL